MQFDSELIDPMENLRQQIAINREQLRYLNRLAVNENLFGALYLAAALIVILGVGAVVYVMLVPNRNFAIPEDVRGLAGIISVFLIFLSTPLFSRAASARNRFREIKYHCSQQMAALDAADEALGLKHLLQKNNDE